MRSFLLLLALSAAPAAAQDASPLEQAESSLKSGNWQAAAAAAGSVLDDAAAASAHASAWRTLGDALVQGGYPYGAVVAYGKGIEIAPVAVSPSYGLVLPLVEPVDEDVWIGRLVGQDLGVPMDDSARGRVALLAARAAFDAGSWGEALALTQLVGRGDPAFLEAEVLRGVTLAQQQRYSEALVPMATSFEGASAANKDDHYVATLALNTARTFFASGNFGQAMAYYDKVPRSDGWWPTAQYERAWAHFRVDDVPGTLALLITHQSPYFEDWYFPEADLLRAQALYLMCKFPETSKVMNAFKDHYQPVLEGLTATIGQLDATSAYADATARLAGQTTRLPEPFMRRFDDDDRLADASKAIQTADGEIARLRKASGTWASRAADALQARRDTRVAIEGGRVLELARDARADLDGMLQSIELTQVDLLTLEARLYDQAAAGGGQADLGGSDRIRELRRKNKRVWPFQGEYWMDELGHFQIVARPDCPESLRRGP